MVSIEKKLVSFVGMPGTGKSTIGRLLATRLRTNFTDSDHVIEQTLGCSIRDFFHLYGELSFRDVEQRVIKSLLDSTGGVLATGGGAVLCKDTISALRHFSHVVYLRAPVDELFKRLKRDKTRPLLQGEDGQRIIERMFEVRDPIYLESCHMVVDTRQLPQKKIVELILKDVEKSSIKFSV